MYWLSHLFSISEDNVLVEPFVNGSTNTLSSEILNKWFNQYIIFRNTEQMVQPIHCLQKHRTSNYEADLHDTAQILLKVAFNTTTPTPYLTIKHCTYCSDGS
jgi:hypothetical protein